MGWSGWAAQAVRPSCLSAGSGKQQAAFKAKTPGRVAYRVGDPITRAQGTTDDKGGKGRCFCFVRQPPAVFARRYNGPPREAARGAVLAASPRGP